MITKECVTAIWRIYAEGITQIQAETHQADFEGVCFIMHLTDTKIFVKGMLADMTLPVKREFIRACEAEGIEVIQMERATNRRLPFARRIDDHHEMRVKDLLDRLNRDTPQRRIGDQPNSELNNP